MSQDMEQVCLCWYVHIGLKYNCDLVLEFATRFYLQIL